MSCEVWPDDYGPCGGSEVERLWFVNEWMDHHGHGAGRATQGAWNEHGHGLNPSDVETDQAHDFPGPPLGLGLCETHLGEYLLDNLLRLTCGPGGADLRSSSRP